MGNSRIAKILIALFTAVTIFSGCASEKMYYSIQDANTSKPNAGNNIENTTIEEPYSEKVLEFTPPENHFDFPAKEFVDEYVNAISAAIENGEFSMVKPFLKRDSSLYTAQEKRVAKLHSEGTKEYVLDCRIEEFEWNSNTKGSLVLYEKIDTVDSEGESTITEVTYRYTIEYVNGRYVLSDRTKETD